MDDGVFVSFSILYSLQKCHLRLRPSTEVAIPDKWIELIKAISFTLHRHFRFLSLALFPSLTFAVEIYRLSPRPDMKYPIIYEYWQFILRSHIVRNVPVWLLDSCVPHYTQNTYPSRPTLGPVGTLGSLYIFEILACTCLWCITQQTVDRPSVCVRLTSEQNKFSTVRFNVRLMLMLHTVHGALQH